MVKQVYRPFLGGKAQAIDQILKEKYLPETGKAYKWTAFKSPEGGYVLWLIDAEGNGFIAKSGEPLTQPQPGEAGVGELDSKGIGRAAGELAVPCTRNPP